jgi:hypothetical protein
MGSVQSVRSQGSQAGVREVAYRLPARLVAEVDQRAAEPEPQSPRRRPGFRAPRSLDGVGIAAVVALRRRRRVAFKSTALASRR